MRVRFGVVATILLSAITSFSQTTAVVEISLQNTKNIRVERPTFFEKATNYKLTMIREGRYKLEYLSSKPGILFLNSRPVFITPGDNIQLTHKIILRTVNIYKDTLIASGTNKGNYTFSNFTDRRRKNEVYPEFSEKKYSSDMTRFYNDLVSSFSDQEKYITSCFSKGFYSKELIAYIQRKERLDFLSNLVYYEELIAKKYPDQLPEFSKKLESDFRSTVFLPSDTGYSRRMEEIFKNYLYHLVYIKCNGVTDSKDFDKLIASIQAFHNPFVREYLLCFLITDYYEIWNKNKSSRTMALVENINNPIIISELKKYLRSE